MRPKRWRVRVRTIQEDWIELQADSAGDAEVQASKLPRVISVFFGSTISAEKPLGMTLSASIENDDE